MLEYVLGLATIATLTINSCGLECGKVTRLSRDGRVIGGNAVSPDVVYPWMVAFVLADTLTGSRPPVVRCAGSLITRRHILTAAHCYGRNGTEEDMIGKFLLVYMLRDKCQDHGEFLVEPQADRVIVHPGFRERTFVNDIAIVVLETEVPYTPICLPTSVAEKRDAMILGYGSVFPHTIYPCLLQQAIVNIYGKNKCGVPSAAAVICAGRLEGGIDTCDELPLLDLVVVKKAIQESIQMFIDTGIGFMMKLEEKDIQSCMDNNGGYSGEGSNVSASNNKIKQTRDQVDEVVGIMKVNVEKVLERDQKLSDLNYRADALQHGAQQFEQQAGKLKRKMWWKNIKMMIIMGVIGGILLLIIIVWIAGSFGGGDSDGDKIAPASTTTIKP
ncbi:hypothetical protein AAG570_005917 [Ranatra chinensis]|uniref:V-SNARE coiled-coil homology domain-containing protein n=1 Tax=Ranatra chinensis TaxID=642074 RepID=A0ABD0XWI3_9HEMI